MTISAKIILGSEFNGKRLTTFELTYPRFIHAEFMTHRVFSRNAASSRAIPIKKMLANIWSNMAEPIHWGAHQPGMQAEKELPKWKKWLTRKLWRASGKVAVGFAYLMDKLGGHKQLVNRIVEPWSHITVIMTTTELDNFFELRDHPDAQPEIHELARQMRKCVDEYQYTKLKNDEWHLPYVQEYEIGKDGKPIHRDKMPMIKLIKISVARCARVSYLTHDGKISDYEKDVKLYDRLVGSVPLHASPAEHQACPLVHALDRPFQGNFNGFIQFRKILEEKMAGRNSSLISSVFDYK